MRVCPINPKKEKPTMDCFNKPEHHLRRTDNSKAYWYIKDATVANIELSQEYKLPDTISCDEGCLLQWEWIAYQKCVMRYAGPDLDILEEAQGKTFHFGDQSNGQICYENSRDPPELFYNCADVIIKSNGGLGYSYQPKPSEQKNTTQPIAQPQPQSSQVQAQTLPTQQAQTQDHTQHQTQPQGQATQQQTEDQKRKEQEAKAAQEAAAKAAQEAQTKAAQDAAKAAADAQKAKDAQQQQHQSQQAHAHHQAQDNTEKPAPRKCKSKRKSIPSAY